MASSRAVVGVVALAALVALAGCGQLLGGGDEPARESTLTPAPVPTTAELPPTATDDSQERVRINGSRYDLLRPTCARPPSVVVHIQVAALANNDPTTDDGIRTAWRFASPENKQYTGPYRNFADMVTSFYRPLLAAETVRYGALERHNESAHRRVTVSGNGTTAAYRWRLEKVSSGPFEGCWMTSGVGEVPVHLGTDHGVNRVTTRLPGTATDRVTAGPATPRAHRR